MNTLSRAITAQNFNASDTHIALQKHWGALMNSSRKHELSASHHILYLALLGKDWRQGFSPVTNQRKLANGGFFQWRLFPALTLFHSKWHETWLLAPFDGIVTSEMLASVRRLVPKVSAYTYNPEDFALGHFPFEAYEELDEIAPATMREQDYRHA